MLRTKQVLISLFFILCACLIARKMISTRVEVVTFGIDNLPKHIGEYTSVEIPIEDKVVRELNTDGYIFRKYVNGSDEMLLYIGYYGTRKGGRSDHTPAGCYPGSGWSIIDSYETDMELSVNGRPRHIRLNSLLVKKGHTNELVFYWYQSQADQVLTSGIKMNLYRFTNKMLHNRNDGSFIRVSTPIIKSIDVSESKMKIFVQTIFPLIVNHWPVEKDI